MEKKTRFLDVVFVVGLLPSTSGCFPPVQNGSVILGSWVPGFTNGGFLFGDAAKTYHRSVIVIIIIIVLLIDSYR